MRNTKVQGWSVKVSVERRVERDASPGAEPLRVIKFVAKSPKAVTVFSKTHAEHTKNVANKREREREREREHRLYQARFDGKCTQEDTRMRQAERRLAEIRGGRGGDGRPACTARMDYLTDRRSENSSFGYRTFGVIIGNGNGNWGN